MANMEYQVERLELANLLLKDKKIVDIRYASEEEVETMGWSEDFIVFTMEDGTMFYPSKDHEGNDAGVIFLQEKVSLDGPILFHQF
jgi:hypothetical protein